MKIWLGNTGHTPTLVSGPFRSPTTRGLASPLPPRKIDKGRVGRNAHEISNPARSLNIQHAHRDAGELAAQLNLQLKPTDQGASPGHPKDPQTT